MKGEEGTQVELGLLEDLDLPDVDLFFCEPLFLTSSAPSDIRMLRTFWRG